MTGFPDGFEEWLIRRANRKTFNREYLCEYIRDCEYETFLKQWMEYRQKTNHLPVSYNWECFKVHRQIFGEHSLLGSNKNYQRAKLDSMRFFSTEDDHK